MGDQLFTGWKCEIFIGRKKLALGGFGDRFHLSARDEYELYELLVETSCQMYVALNALYHGCMSNNLFSSFHVLSANLTS